MQPGTAAEAIARARDLAAAERSLGVFVEPAVHGWAEGLPALMAVACVIYLLAHVPATAGALVWARLEHPRAFPWLRDVFVATQLLVLAGAMVAPTAPPSRLPEEGFADATGAFWGGATTGGAHVLQSPFAAMPSGHVAFALIAGGAVAVLARRRWIRALGALYPVLVVAITVMTANHFLLDAAGAVVAVAAGLGATALRRTGMIRVCSVAIAPVVPTFPSPTRAARTGSRWRAGSGD